MHIAISYMIYIHKRRYFQKNIFYYNNLKKKLFFIYLVYIYINTIEKWDICICIQVTTSLKKRKEDRCEWDVCDNYGSQHQKREESLKIMCIFIKF